MKDLTCSDFAPTDMVQLLHDGIWVGSQSMTMILFFTCITFLIGFVVWYEFFADRAIDRSQNKASNEIKDLTKKMAKKSKKL